ncbi:outer membrane lipoprotein carrier protein LolA [Bisgaard Taxon 10/6]|uniref:LolA family protein n=1 Tax=Exercitatus varius TaxID=67857 RepID=UPI00294ABC46|nr:outer membrane lipoprotein carrier protein LolA [Exercitatus varius]MDG2961317.1 outer membrane lipoprotein carrier protein LolA [Exercitatus varius]
MKKRFILLLWLVAGHVSAFSQTELTDLLRKPQITQGHFIQQRFLKSLSKPITATGEFTLVKNKGLLWQMQKPFESSQRVTPEGIMQWNGESWVATNSLAQNQQIRLFLGLLGGDVESLKNQFDLHLSGEAEHWVLRLIPNTVLIQQIFTAIEIQGDHSVKQIELREKQGDKTLIRFNRVSLDKPLSAFAQSAL